MPSKILNLKQNSSFSSKRNKSISMSDLQKDIIDKKLNKNKIFSEHIKLEEENLFLDKHRGYILNRIFEDYDHVFQEIFSNSNLIKSNILETLIYFDNKHNKKTIKVLDDGAGQGLFLSLLKTKWNSLKQKNKVKSNLETTAVVLSDTLVIKKYIDKKLIGNVANLKFVEKYDFIFSIFGGFNYSISDIKKEVLLKYIYSLNKDGVGVFGFSADYVKSKVLSNDNLNEIRNGLKKRGFETEFKALFEVSNVQNYKLPPFYLLVKRII